MLKEEKILLLQLILEDIRSNWGCCDLEPRVNMALNLAEELGLTEHVSRIKNYIKLCNEGDCDGRFFRINYKYGGYEDMKELHGLEATILDKSDDFMKTADAILTYPEYRFDDWDDFLKKIRRCPFCLTNIPDKLMFDDACYNCGNYLGW